MNAGSLGLLQKRNRLKFQTFHLLFCPFIRKILPLIGHPEYFWIYILLLIKQSDVLQMVHSNITKKKKKECIILKCETYAQSISLFLKALTRANKLKLIS